MSNAAALQGLDACEGRNVPRAESPPARPAREGVCQIRPFSRRAAILPPSKPSMPRSTASVSWPRAGAAQIEPCRELLREEMLALRPTHILMPVGLGWFRGDGRYDFSRLFEAVTPGAGAVEATARFRLPDGTAAPALITCRPEFRNEDGFARDVLEAFKGL